MGIYPARPRRSAAIEDRSSIGSIADGVRLLRRDGRARSRFPLLRLICAAHLFALTAAVPAIAADDGWNPFEDGTGRYSRPQRKSQPRPPARPREDRRTAPPADSGQAYPRAPAAADYQPQYSPQFSPGSPPVGPAAASVERGELAPVRSATSGLPFALWQGLSAEDVERLIAPLALPVRSPALQKLWLSILAAEDDQAGGAKLAALRAEALYRSGRLGEAAAVIAGAAGDEKNATAQVLRARIEIARGNRDDGCRAAKQAGKNRTKITKSLRGEAVVLAGYCAIAGGNKAAAGLAAELARDLAYRNRFTLAVLDAIASGRTTKRRLPKTVSPLQYLLCCSRPASISPNV